MSRLPNTSLAVLPLCVIEKRLVSALCCRVWLVGDSREASREMEELNDGDMQVL